MSGIVQNTVGIYNALGVPGDLAFTGPIRAKSYNLYSAGVPNVVGYAFTETAAASPNPAGAAGNGATAQVGGSGLFAGILINPKEDVLYGTTAGGTLAPSLVVPDYASGQLLYMGEIFVNLPGPANPGDLVTYDPLTGALNSIAPTVTFTGSIAAGGDSTNDVLTVSAITAGQLAIGSVISGAGIPVGTSIVSLGTGLGFTGTYNISTINLLTVSSEAMTANAIPAPVFTSTGYITANSTYESIWTVSTITGEVVIGQQIFGIGMPDNTVVTGYDSGVGGTGTYYVNQVGLTLFSSGTHGTVTGPANLLVPNAVVDIYGANVGGGVAAIKLTN